MSRSVVKGLRAGACIAAALLCSASWAAEPAACTQVKLGSTNWSDTVATSAMAQIALESLGYQVKLTTASQQIILAGLADNKLDTFLGYWQPTMRPVAEPYVHKQRIQVIEPAALPDAQSTFAVPRYAFDAGLRTFADIARFKDKLGSRIYVIEPGSGSNRITAKMIDSDQFGLKGFTLMESSEAGMLTAVKRAVSRNEWVVFFGWKPHPMNLQLDMVYLTGSEDVFGPDEGAATVSVMTAQGYGERCPNVGRLLHNLSFRSDQVSHLMVPILERVAPKDAALAWLKQNPEQVKGWFEGVETVDGKPGFAAFQTALSR
ncbi:MULTISPECIES: choline ABC transporter substrate-binding protein [Pseudomonas]|uniref:choline ABC transporter substrate-binding protein n=1 Tax=Pseudomonas TaxID=286 RepID=UPI001E483773|nr:MULTISPECIES: choline ABC transporter substrate-binding protein [Pseudomonas]MCE1117336.1 choline ABC transporter substrate-binding protein [Pseudomonas sp. NMI795_08]